MLDRRGGAISMRIDHLVINVGEKYQKDQQIIEAIRKQGFPYEPTKGKGTKGFKASNLWIDNEYFEMIRILKEDGGGWVEEWTKRYLEGHRGLICLMIDVEDIEALYEKLKSKGITLTRPEWLRIKLLLGITMKMPWRNSYLSFFEKVPFQIGFQQIKDKKSLEYMRRQMEPNSRQNHIEGISKVVIYGGFTDKEFDRLSAVFESRANRKVDEEGRACLEVRLNSKQKLELIEASNYKVEVYTTSKVTRDIEASTTIENITLC